MAYLASSFVLEVVVRFRFGTGILHSIEKATQFVHGTLLHRQQCSRILSGALTLMMLHHSGPLGSGVSHARQMVMLPLYLA